jgi:hypothetical protein
MYLVLEGSQPNTQSGSCDSGTTKIPAAKFKQPFTIVKSSTTLTQTQMKCTTEGEIKSGGCACGDTQYVNCGADTYGKYCYKDTNAQDFTCHTTQQPTPGVAVGGVCGPATGTTTPTGTCKKEQCGIDNRIANDKITDLNKKCQSDLYCCS